jgi:hypothetical protein
MPTLSTALILAALATATTVCVNTRLARSGLRVNRLDYGVRRRVGQLGDGDVPGLLHDHKNLIRSHIALAGSVIRGGQDLAGLASGSEALFAFAAFDNWGANGKTAVTVPSSAGASVHRFRRRCRCSYP